MGYIYSHQKEYFRDFEKNLWNKLYNNIKSDFDWYYIEPEHRIGDLYCFMRPILIEAFNNGEKIFLHKNTDTQAPETWEITPERFIELCHEKGVHIRPQLKKHFHHYLQRCGITKEQPNYNYAIRPRWQDLLNEYINTRLTSNCSVAIDGLERHNPLAKEMLQQQKIASVGQIVCLLSRDLGDYKYDKTEKEFYDCIGKNCAIDCIWIWSWTTYKALMEATLAGEITIVNQKPTDGAWQNIQVKIKDALIWVKNQGITLDADMLEYIGEVTNKEQEKPKRSIGRPSKMDKAYEEYFRKKESGEVQSVSIELCESLRKWSIKTHNKHFKAKNLRDKIAKAEKLQSLAIK
jgi:hypothetical protein